MDSLRVRSAPGKGTVVTMKRKIALRGGRSAMTKEMRVLLRRAGKGDNDACEKLIEENSGLIWSIVRRYCGRRSGGRGSVSVGVPRLFESGARF